MHIKKMAFGTLLPLLALSAHAQSVVPPTAKFAPIENTDGYQDRFIIRYRDGASELKNPSFSTQHLQATANRAGLNRPASAAQARISHVRTMTLRSEVFRVSRALSPSEANAFMRYVAADPAVEYVEPDTKMYLYALSAPQSLDNSSWNPAPYDPYLLDQWNLHDPRSGAHALQAWNIATGDDVTVAVIDTGTTRHSDLDMSLADDGYDFIGSAFTSGREDDGRQRGGWDSGDWTTTEPWASQCVFFGGPKPSTWHGTHVAGTIAALRNGEGSVGVAYRAKILPIRALGHCGGNTSDIADAIVWASGGSVPGVPDNKHPAQVINLSLGGQSRCGKDSTFARAIRAAMDNGSTVVAAAGNAGIDARHTSPASCDGVIAVAATNIEGKRSWYSNYGNVVALAAPGGDDDGLILATYNTGQTHPDSPSYKGSQGTSMAAPHVSGAVALMIDARNLAGLPPLSPTEIKQILMRTARPVAFQDNKKPIGTGILDAKSAVLEAALSQ